MGSGKCHFLSPLQVQPTHLTMGLHVASLSTITLRRRYNCYPHFIARETETGRDVPGTPFHESGLQPDYHPANKGQNQDELPVLMQVQALCSKHGVVAVAHGRSRGHTPHLAHQTKEVIHELSANMWLWSIHFSKLPHAQPPGHIPLL